MTELLPIKLPPMKPELGPEERALVRPKPAEQMTADEFYARKEPHRLLTRRPKARISQEAFDAIESRIKAYADFEGLPTEEQQKLPEDERPKQVEHDDQVIYVKGKLFGLFRDSDLAALQRAEAKRQRRIERNMRNWKSPALKPVPRG